MDFKRVSTVLCWFAVIGFFASFIWYQSADSKSFAGGLFKAEEHEYVQFRAMAALGRARGDYTGPIEDAKADAIDVVRLGRASDGKHGMLTFGVVLIVGVALFAGSGQVKQQNTA